MTREVVDIVNAFQELSKTGKRSALATVVDVSGSTYRRPGARMLFSEEGRLAGLINAACLESDLSERVKRIIAKGIPELIAYDTTAPDDIILGLGLGCNGIVQILVEPSQSKVLNDKIAFLERRIAAEEASVLATVFQTSGNTRIQLCDYMALDDERTLNGTIVKTSLASVIRTDATTVLKQQASMQKEYPVENGRVRVFLEFVRPPLRLIVFGAGPDALPLVETAKNLAWHVTVVDHRPAMATKQNAPRADSIVLSRPEELKKSLPLNRNHIAVVMTHNFEIDSKLIQVLLGSPVQYVGLLGPRTKLDTVLQNLDQAGFKPTDEQLDRLHGPIGLDIGAETPEEIALSIISEIKAVTEGRPGGFLKHRKGAIH
jgi:xanthine dehydrogenase accessory factor